MPDAQATQGDSPPSVSFREALAVWCEVALKSFGGPAGQIAVMHRILVEQRRWVSEERFLHALNYCMLLPGPEAQQLATYIGWLLHGYRGGLAAGILFVLPGAVCILIFSYVYAGFGQVGFVKAMFFGLKAAVLAVVVEAVVRIGKRVLKNGAMASIAAAAFVALFFFAVPFPLVVLAAAAIGFAGGSLRPQTFAVIQAGAPGARKAKAVVDALLDEGIPDHARPSARRALRVASVCLPLWFGPLALLRLLRGGDDVYVQIGAFFSKAAVVTFGGAYAVLAYIAQQAVEHYGWLRPGEMLDGLGMAETTPGPLIMVVQFVGFLAAYRNPGNLDPMVAGTFGAMLTTWVTFVPCFLWIFLGAPYVELLRGRRELSAALSAITAAVVGVVLNLAVWFSLHVLFGTVAEMSGPFGMRLFVPSLDTIDPAAALIAAAAFVAIFRFHVGMIPTLAASTLAGIAIWLCT